MQLIETVAENDDDMLHKFLEGETPTPEELKKALRKATIDMKVFPVMCGTAFKNKGVQTLLDAVVDYLPSPLDVPAVEGIDPSDHSVVLVREAKDDAPFSALAFKLINDPFGKLELYPPLLGFVEDRGHGFESAHGQDRTCGSTGQDAREQA